MRLFALAALLGLLTGCMGLYPTHDWDALINGKFEAYGAVINCSAELFPLPPDVTYRSYDVLMDEMDAQAEVEMWTPAELQDKRLGVPMGGLFVLHLKANTIEHVDPANWRMVILSGGERILSTEGGHRVGFYAHPFWRGVWVVTVPVKPSGAMEVNIIPKGGQTRLQCTVTPAPVSI